MEVPEEVRLRFTPESRKQIEALMDRSGLELQELLQHVLITFDNLQAYQGDGATIAVHLPDGREIEVPSLWNVNG